MKLHSKAVAPAPSPPSPPEQKPATPKRRPPQLQPYKPFPLDSLPVPIGEYVRQAAIALGCDSSYVAAPALAAIASAIGNTRTIQLKRGWSEPSIVWAVVVGDSGSLKTPAYLTAVRYHFWLQERAMQEYRRQMERFEIEMELHQSAKKRTHSTSTGETPQKPILKKLIGSDTTVEKLAEILEDNERGILIARDELAGWFGSFSRYKGKGGGTDLPNWLELFRAGTLVIDRKTGDRPSLFVPRAAVSVTGSIQPGTLAKELTPDFLDAGLAARLLMVMPPRMTKEWSEAEIDSDTEQSYHDTIDRLFALEFRTTGDGERIPHTLRMSGDAKKRWVEFYNEWAAQQAAVEGELAAAFSKLEAYAARFALIHHVVSYAGLGQTDLIEIGAESIEAGIMLCRWFAEEASRIYSILAESTDEKESRTLMEYIRIRPGGRITARDLQKSNSRKYRSSEAAEESLQSLVDQGVAEWKEIRAGAKGGRNTRACELLNLPDDTTDTTDIADTTP